MACVCVQVAETTRDVEAGEEILIAYGQMYFDQQRALIVHRLREGLQRLQQKNAADAAFFKGAGKLLDSIEQLVRTIPRSSKRSSYSLI